MEGVGIIASERLTGVPNPLIINWIRNYAKILGELIAKATVSKKLENIEILKMDALIHISYVFVDRNQNKILGQCP